jgi:TRAP-type mannitol/chloroaromatic compound transport system substrate-binding protein
VTKVSRRKFINKSAAFALTAPSLLAMSCTSNDKKEPAAPYINFNKSYRWRMITTWPPNFPILGEGCALFANMVNEMSGGRLQIQVFGGGELVPALEVFDAVSNGVAQLGHAAPYYWAGKAPASQFFATVPFGMNAQQMMAWLLSGEGMQLWEELYAEHNLIPFLSGNSGIQLGGWFNKEINSIQDIQGLKMRIPGLGGKVITEAGGSAVLTAGGEIYTNMERGVLDATEWIGPYHDFRLGLHKVSRFCYFPGWHEPGTVFETFVNKNQFEELPSDLQGIIRTAAKSQYSWSFAEFENKNSQFLQKLIHEENVRLRPFPNDVLMNLKRISGEVLNNIAKKDASSQKIYNSYMKFKKGMEAWANLTEKLYYTSL